MNPSFPRCAGYLSLSPLRNGLLYPLFTVSGVNVPFVQVVNADSQIDAFVPFYDVEYASIVPSLAGRQAQVGHAALLAYYDANKILVETDAEELKAGWQSLVLSEDQPLPTLTRLHIVRVVGADPTLKRSLAKEFLNQNGVSGAMAAAVMRSEARFDQDIKSFWGRVSRFNDTPEAGPARSVSIERFIRLSTEELFEWLFEAEVDRLWHRVLNVLIRRIVFDERIFDLLAKLVSAEGFDILGASDLEKRIVAMGIHLFRLSGGSDVGKDFIDCLEEFVSSGQMFDMFPIMTATQVIELMEWMELHAMLSTSVGSVLIEMLHREDLPKHIAVPIVSHLLATVERLSSDTVSHQDNNTLLDKFRLLVAHHGRLGLVLPAGLRKRVLAISG